MNARQFSRSTVLAGAEVWLHGREPNAAPRDLLIEQGLIRAIEAPGRLARDAPAGAGVIDLCGGLILPAFFDGHLHLELGGRSLRDLDLTEVRRADAVLRRVAEGCGRGSGWLKGIGLHESAWPALGDLNRAARNRPLLIVTRDVHSAFLNRAALKELRITKTTALPEGGWMELDARGEPTGVFHENAVDWIEELLPKETEEERLDLLECAMNHLARLGVLGATDAGSREIWPLLEKLERAGRLPLRVECCLRCLSLEDTCLDGPRGATPRLRRSRVKVFLDGALGSRTAWMRAPYLDRPDLRPEPVADLDRFRSLLREGVKRGWSFMVHALGDGAVAFALDALRDLPAPSGRHRIEHVQHVDADLLHHPAWERLIPSLQPRHRTEDLGMLAARLGAERAARSYPARSLWRGHRPLVLGTDWPVVPADPLRTLHDAILPRREGEGMPNEELAIAQAVEGATRGAALAAGFHGVGEIEAGAPADLVWLRENPGEDPAAWGEAELGSIFTGKDGEFRRIQP